MNELLNTINVQTFSNSAPHITIITFTQKCQNSSLSPQNLSQLIYTTMLLLTSLTSSSKYLQCGFKATSRLPYFHFVKENVKHTIKSVFGVMVA